MITAIEYDRLYAHEAGWEYWFGQARRKPVPTELHGVLQLILGHLLRLAGYRASSETELRVIPDWYPRPDVLGVFGRPLERYPTRPIDVAFEIWSEGEDAEEKCRLYAQIGIPQIFYFFAEKQESYLWNGAQLVLVEDVVLGNGSMIQGERIWEELATEIARWGDETSSLS